jgi:hypothetical protein
MNWDRLDDKKRPVLAKLPSIYNHLTHIPGFHTTPNVNRKASVQRYFPNRNSPTRVKLTFSSNPFPHLDVTVTDPVPDRHLERMQKESEQRREPYPQTGIVKIREGDIPDILHPTYSEYENQVSLAFGLLEIRNRNQKGYDKAATIVSPLQSVKVALPLPSMLHKPIGKEEYVEKINSFNNRANQTNSITKTRLDVCQSSDYCGDTVDQAIYLQHVLQPDFSDFEQTLMIQKPMVIYLQQKPIRNPLKYYR